MLENIEVLIHSCIKISGEKTIYFDPFKIEKECYDADFVFITHEHYDHYSEDDIDKVMKNNTKFVIPQTMEQKLIKKGIKQSNIVSVIPGKSYTEDSLQFETIPAYNNYKPFHPKRNGWVGYNICINNNKYYIAGDTDITDENRNVKCDVAFVPVGGTYTMNAKEAAKLVNEIKPKLAIPIHYGAIVGKESDADEFLKLLSNDIEGKKLIK